MEFAVPPNENFVIGVSFDNIYIRAEDNFLRPCDDPVFYRPGNNVDFDRPPGEPDFERV